MYKAFFDENRIENVAIFRHKKRKDLGVIVFPNCEIQNMTFDTLNEKGEIKGLFWSNSTIQPRTRLKLVKSFK